jgi:hypothetical protein
MRGDTALFPRRVDSESTSRLSVCRDPFVLCGLGKLAGKSLVGGNVVCDTSIRCDRLVAEIGSGRHSIGIANSIFVADPGLVREIRVRGSSVVRGRIPSRRAPYGAQPRVVP